ncbi:MAG: secretion protein HlyD [Methylibium sp. NZG]|nr:MAG: secretion protein HlyD [Methylibium sp. NZG]
MRKAWWVVAVAVLAAAGIAAMVTLRLQASKAEEERKKAAAANVTLEFTAAEVVTPQRVSLPQWIEFSGPLVAPGTAVVRVKAPGTLLSFNVVEGSRVNAGQVLGKVDLADLNSRVTERSAALESSRAQLAQAERQHQANQRLADQQFISGNALEASAAALESARAQFTASQAQLSSTRVSLRDAALVAPIDGVVAKRHVLPGEKLSMEQNVLTLVDLSLLELAGSVGTHEVAQLEPGMAVQVQVEGAAQPVAGTIGHIAPAAEAGTRSIGVTIALQNPKETFRAGQYAMARVQLRDPAERLTVPIGAIGQTSGQEHVWLIENGALLRRTVTTGRRDAALGRVEILDGVGVGAQVLAVRFDNLKEGGKAVVVAGKAVPAKGTVASAPASANAR